MPFIMLRTGAHAVLLLPLFMGGCVTDDFSEMSQGFTAPTPAEAARNALDPYNADKRREGVVLLANATFGGAAPYMKMYRDYVEHDKDPLVRAAAITALGRHGSPEDALLIAPLLERTLDVHQHVRWTAALALQRLHNPAVVPDLIEAIVDQGEVGEVREACCGAMGQYPEDRVMHALFAALDTRELAVNAAAAQSLNELTGQDWGFDRTAWNTWYTAAIARGDAFTGQRDYTYPTYTRDLLWWAHVAFWVDWHFEKPPAPAGLEPIGTRSPYGADG